MPPIVIEVLLTPRIFEKPEHFVERAMALIATGSLACIMITLRGRRQGEVGFEYLPAL